MGEKGSTTFMQSIWYLRLRNACGVARSLVQNGMRNTALPALPGLHVLFPGSVGLDGAAFPHPQTAWHHHL